MVLPMAAGATSATRQITAVSGVDNVVLLLAGAVAVAALTFAIRSLDPGLPLRSRIALAGLRTAVIAACFVLFVQPTLHIRTMKVHPASIAVLVDTSGSMRRGDLTRLSMAQDILRKAKGALSALQKDHTMLFYGFSDELYPTAGIDFFQTKASPGTKTDIRHAIDQLLSEGGGQTVQSIILISDGADSELGFTPGGERPLDWAAKLGVPVNTVAVEDAPNRIDLSILRVDAAPIAFLRSETPVTVTVGAVGIPDREIEAFLKRDGAVVQRRTTRLVGGKARLTFAIMPLELGRRVYEVSVPIPEKDEVPENNRSFFSVDVVRDKYRILHLAGRPSWDQRFLRDTLKSWPRVDLVSFYILRTSYQSGTEGSAGMALIPFPTEELFNDHLGEFDIVIFHDFDPTEVGVDAYGEKLTEFVRNGGALAIIGGGTGLVSDSLGDKALEALLPVTLLPPGTAVSRRTDTTPFRARLTAEGAAHPITRLKERDEENKQMWRSMAALDGIGRIAKMRPGAHTLLDHPGLFADDGPHPVVAVIDAGKGRTLAVLTDSLWRWRFTGPMNGGAPDVYTDFWHKVVQWLTRSPDLSRLRATVTPSPVVRGDWATFDVELLDESYRPAAGEQIRVTVTWTAKDGTTASDIFESTTDDQGKFRREWRPKVDGAHRIQVTSGNGLETASPFLVVSNNREQNHLDADASLMKALAEATGGRFEVNRLIPSEIAMNPSVGKEVVEQSALSLWDHPLTLALTMLLLFAEWILRRRRGLD